MTLIVRTARISYAGPDRLDVTRKSAKADALPFAPSWSILGPALELRRTGGPVALAYAWPEYAAAYVAEMRASYRAHRPAWDALLARESVTLVCYCADADHCHRRLLAEIVVRLGAVDKGEIALGQMALIRPDLNTARGRSAAAEKPVAFCWRCGQPGGDDWPTIADPTFPGESMHLDCGAPPWSAA